MQLAKIIDGKKFMWDGAEYKEEAEARTTMEKYMKDLFEARIVNEDGRFYIFTRRPVGEAKPS